jgi:antitoxin HigA-1
MIMKSPPHPGFLVRHACLDALALSVSDAAVILGVSRQALSNVVNGRANISADMAIRLEKAFGSTADTWLRMQMAYDLAQARSRAKTMKVRRYRPLAASA